MLIEKAFDTGELSLCYVEGPASGPPVVLLHGLSHRWQTWDRMIPRLTSSWHVYAVDQRGHGRSAHGAQYRVVDYARDVVAFLHRLDEPAVLVGHSLGGLVALAVASENTVGVRAVVSVDPGLFLRNSSIDSDPVRKNWNVWLYEVLKGKPSYDALAAHYRVHLPNSAEAEIKTFADQHYGLAAGVIEALVRDQLFEGLNLANALKAIECPTLILQGDWSNGGAMRHEDADFVRHNLPAAAIENIPDGGHVYPRESADIILQHMRAFLRSV